MVEELAHFPSNPHIPFCPSYLSPLLLLLLLLYPFFFVIVVRLHSSSIESSIPVSVALFISVLSVVVRCVLCSLAVCCPNRSFRSFGQLLS
ncbi:hypothetical protein EDD21DRAFT_86581 [Dissophora ornata]|nr:hypothetical protein EDD21DRAFT_86581 [Dissophora ornata]